MPKLGDHQQALYDAEDKTINRLGRRWALLRDAQAYLDELIGSAWFFDRWPTLHDVRIERRGHGSRWSTNDRCTPHAGVILVADGQLDQPTVLHELAHLVTPLDEGHGVLFAGVLLRLVRHEMGAIAWIPLYHELHSNPLFSSLRDPTQEHA